MQGLSAWYYPGQNSVRTMGACEALAEALVSGIGLSSTLTSTTTTTTSLSYVELCLFLFMTLLTSHMIPLVDPSWGPNSAKVTIGFGDSPHRIVI